MADYCDDYRGRVMIGVAFGLWGLAIVAVGLRFLSRYLARAPFWWDDWMIVLALIFSGGYSISTIPLYIKGVGMHESCAAPDATEFWLKTLLAWEFVYTAIIVSVKYSILLFLRRVFAVRSFKPYFWGMWTVVTLWGIAIIIVSALSCIPLRAFWGDGTGKCVNTKAFYVGNAVPNIVTDAALLVLPIPWILRLNIPKAIRWSLIGVFGCGAAVIIISCIRLSVLMSTEEGPDMVYDDPPEAVWTIAENNVAIISACLPSLGPLVKRAFKYFGIKHGMSKSGSNMSESKSG